MRTSYPKPMETMERITRQFLCDHFDEILERVDKEDIGFVILNVIRRMLQNSGKVLDNASPIITSRLAKEMSDSIFSRLTSVPRSIRAEINETTKRKKAGFFRREISEAQAVLAASGREGKFPN